MAWIYLFPGLFKLTFPSFHWGNNKGNKEETEEVKKNTGTVEGRKGKKKRNEGKVMKLRKLFMMDPTTLPLAYPDFLILTN